MEGLMEFENKELGKVRVLEMKNEYWWVAKDIAEILGYSETEPMTRRLDDDERDFLTLENIKTLQIVGFENATFLKEKGFKLEETKPKEEGK